MKNLDRKKAQVEELRAALKETVLLLDLQGVPTRILQKVRKKVKEEGGLLKVYKKAVISRALGRELEDFKVSLGLLTTDSSPYSAYHLVVGSSSGKRFAKPGDVAVEDVWFGPKETTFQPGPILSELKAAGLDVRIEKGRVVIASKSKVLSKGEKISPQKASVLRKLNLPTIPVSIRVVAAYRNGEAYPVEFLALTPEELRSSLENAATQGVSLAWHSGYPLPALLPLRLTEAASQGLSLALAVGYPSSAAITFLIQKAAMEGRVLKKVMGDES